MEETVELIHIQPCAQTGITVRTYQAPNLVENDHHAERLNLTSQSGHVKNNELSGKINIRQVCETGRGTSRKHLQLGDEILRFRRRVLHVHIHTFDLLLQIHQGRLRIRSGRIQLSARIPVHVHRGRIDHASFELA